MGSAPKLPPLLQRKLYKSGQTRGADDDEIYQNRVLRNSTVLIPYAEWRSCKRDYENGSIVLIRPEQYFGLRNPVAQLRSEDLILGRNALVFYETREGWAAHSPTAQRWRPANSRRAPLGGHYVARVPATTGEPKILEGFTSTASKGAGIRVYEYADSATIGATRAQLEALFWLCRDAPMKVGKFGMSAVDGESRRRGVLVGTQNMGLLDLARLQTARTINSGGFTCCPLCLEEIEIPLFFSRVEQARGREVPDLTVTAVSLFHIEELRVGNFGHRPYNVAWGHHHCNVVVKDAGIAATIEWMRRVLARNDGLRAAMAGRE